MTCAKCEHHGKPCGGPDCGGNVALMDPAAALPGTDTPNPALDGNNLAMISHRFTQFATELRGLLLNDCIRFQTVLFDANGQADMNQFADVPFAGIAVWNIGANAVTVEAGPTQGVAPAQGIGVMRIPAGASAGWPSTGTTLTLYGTAGQPVAVALYAKPIQPFASGGGGSSATYPTIIPADATVNPAAAILETEAFGMVWNPTDATWSRARGGRNGADNFAMPYVTVKPPTNTVTQTSPANTQNQITINGNGQSGICLSGVWVSWSGAAPTTGTLTIDIAGTNVIVLDIPLTLNNPFQLILPTGGLWTTTTNNAWHVTVAAGGAGAISKLSVSSMLLGL